MTAEVKKLFDTLMCNYDFPAVFAEGLAEFLIDEGYGQVNELKKEVQDLNNRSVLGLVDANGKITDEPKQGTWEKRIWVVFDSEKVGFRCSECNTTWDSPTKYCPNCGSKNKMEAAE